jgi:hypothetical protein
VKVSRPVSAPSVEVYEVANFGDDDQEYATSLLRTDLDGNGIDELAIGSPCRDPSGDGLVLLVEVGTYVIVGILFPERAPGEGNGHHSEFGRSLVVADWNGDGRLDVAVGDPAADAGAVAGAGETWVFFGPVDASPPVRLRASVPWTGDRFGGTLAAGDFDGDGAADLAVGAPHPAGTTPGADDAGVEVFFGPDFVRRERWWASDGGGRFGAALVAVPSGGAGEALVVGAPEADAMNGDAFAWERALGPGDPLRIASPQPTDAGLGCGGAMGDFDGDGDLELALLAPDRRGGLYFFDPEGLGAGGRVALPAPLSSRPGSSMLRLRDVSGDGADEIVLLSAVREQPAGIFFSPGHGGAHVRFDFAAASGTAGSFDFDSDVELMLSTPTAFSPDGGGYGVLRVVDFSRRMTLSGIRPRPVVIPGASDLR